MKFKQLFYASLFVLVSAAGFAGGAKKEGGTKQKNQSVKEFFSTSTKGLPEVLPSKIMRLKNGESITLEAFPVKQKIGNQWVRRLSYNGMIPGPHLRVTQGSVVKVKLVNKLDLTTTLHPHGLRVDEKYDGVPGIGQAPILPNGSYDYELRFDDAGHFWYHPHIRDDYTQDSGMYGTITVDPASSESLPNFDHEIFLNFDDISQNAADQAYEMDRSTHTLMGRFGKSPYINGRLLGDPEEWKIKQGDVVRFYVLNAANTRTFRFAIKKTLLTLIGSDGGYFEKFENVDAITIGPSERYVFHAKFETAGSFDILHDKPLTPWVVGKVLVAPTGIGVISKKSSKSATSPLFANQADVDRASRRKPDFELSLSVEMDHEKLPMSDMHSGHKKIDSPVDPHLFYYGGRTSGVEWEDEMAEINAKSDDANVTWKMVDVRTGLENMKIDWQLQSGNFYKIRIKNDPDSMHPMQHPIHFHGQQFVVVSVNGRKNENRVWKDTTLVGMGDDIEIILNASNKGRWMAHCHILEHLAAHMMIGFTVK